MTDKGWKQFERRICRDHGDERRPVSGRQTDRHGADNEGRNPFLVIQCKLDKSLPKYIGETVRGTAAKAATQQRLGITIWKEPGLHDNNGVVMLRYDQWLEWFGPLTPNADTQ